MKTIGSAILLTLFTYCVSAQDRGVHFEHGVTWSQIKAKAKAEHKYIFVDCYATWCAPCKKMDNEIYPNDTIGTFMNSHFISVKIQMDTTKNDNSEVKIWHGVSGKFEKDFNITAYPSYLFFSPDGVVVHKGVGLKSKTSFLTFATSALDPQKQYYTFLSKLDNGELNDASLMLLIKSAGAAGEGGQAINIGQKYLQKYIYPLSDKQIYTKEHLQTIRKFMVSSKERGFAIFYHQQAEVNKIMADSNYAQAGVSAMVTKEELMPELQQAIKHDIIPDWPVIVQNIKREFPKVNYEKIVFDGKLTYYDFICGDKKARPEEWYQRALSDVNFNLLDKYGVDTTGFNWLSTANVIEYLVLNHSRDKVLLRKAITWIDQAMQILPDGFTHVYSGLFYRLGYVRQALAWQRVTLARFESDAQLYHIDLGKNKAYNIHQEILKAMKNNEDILPILKKLYVE